MSYSDTQIARGASHGVGLPRGATKPMPSPPSVVYWSQPLSGDEPHRPFETLNFRCRQDEESYAAGRTTLGPAVHFGNLNPGGREELTIKHASLVTGGKDCTGTGVVARWLAEIARSAAVDLPGMSTQRQQQVALKLAALAARLDFCQQIRSAIDGYRSIEPNDPVASNHHGRFVYHLCLLTLAEIKGRGGAMLPVDYFATPEHSNEETYGHATTLVVRLKEGPNKLVEAQAFETNGQWTHWVTPTAIDELRRRADGRQHRGRVIAVEDLSPRDLEYRFSESSGGRKPKVFTRMTIEASLHSLESPFDANKVARDVNIIGDIIFPKLAIRPTPLPIAHQRLVTAYERWGKMSIPAQRLHAHQETGSCELKSLLVASAYLLDDEVAFQFLRQQIVKKSILELKEIQQHYHPFMVTLGRDLSDVNAALNDAVHVAKESETGHAVPREGT